jgi:hypothetical protein
MTTKASDFKPLADVTNEKEKAITPAPVTITDSKNTTVSNVDEKTKPSALATAKNETSQQTNDTEAADAEVTMISDAKDNNTADVFAKLREIIAELEKSKTD